jgi:hypothetical protein
MKASIKARKATATIFKKSEFINHIVLVKNATAKQVIYNNR